MDNGTPWYDIILLGGAIAGAFTAILAFLFVVGRLPLFRWARRRIEEEFDRRAERRTRRAISSELERVLEPIRQQLVTNHGHSLRDAINRIEETGVEHLQFAKLRDLKLESLEAQIQGATARLIVIERARTLLDTHEERLVDHEDRISRLEGDR